MKAESRWKCEHKKKSITYFAILENIFHFKNGIFSGPYQAKDDVRRQEGGHKFWKMGRRRLWIVPSKILQFCDQETNLFNAFTK